MNQYVTHEVTLGIDLRAIFGLFDSIALDRKGMLAHFYFIHTIPGVSRSLGYSARNLLRLEGSDLFFSSQLALKGCVTRIYSFTWSIGEWLCFNHSFISSLRARSSSVRSKVWDEKQATELGCSVYGTEDWDLHTIQCIQSVGKNIIRQIEKENSLSQKSNSPLSTSYHTYSINVGYISLIFTSYWLIITEVHIYSA